MPVHGLGDDDVDTTAEVSDVEEEEEGGGEEANHRHPDPPLSPPPPAGAMATAAAVIAAAAAGNHDQQYHHHHYEHEEEEEEEEEESFFTPQKVRGFHNMAHLGGSSPSPCKKRSRPGSSGGPDAEDRVGLAPDGTDVSQV
jgi:hypothetical protein